MADTGEQPPNRGPPPSGVEGPDWQGLLNWSLAHSDGTRPAHQLSEADRRWFTEALQSQTLDVIQRMKEISMVMQIPPQVLESQGVTVEDLEGMLEELQEHVESIDMANDLHAVGGLVPLLGFLRSQHSSLRAHAAEVVSTIVQNNPKSQHQVLDNQGLGLLVAAFASDSDVIVRTKALGAISSLIRHNRGATAAFRLSDGCWGGLRDALVSGDSKLQRKALQVLLYLFQDDPSDSRVAVELGFPKILIWLANNEDTDIRQAALNSMLEIVRHDPASGMSQDDKEQTKKLLGSRMEQIKKCPAEDLAMVKEETYLVDALWQVCFDEPSPLRGLLVIPEDESSPPDRN